MLVFGCSVLQKSHIIAWKDAVHKADINAEDTDSNTHSLGTRLGAAAGHTGASTAS